MPALQPYFNLVCYSRDKHFVSADPGVEDNNIDHLESMYPGKVCMFLNVVKIANYETKNFKINKILLTI